jgi:predicted HicB family RNase H-like nuclease
LHLRIASPLELAEFLQQTKHHTKHSESYDQRHPFKYALRYVATHSCASKLYFNVPNKTFVIKMYQSLIKSIKYYILRMENMRPMRCSESERLTVYLPKTLLAWLRQEAERQNRSVNNLIFVALQKYQKEAQACILAH